MNETKQDQIEVNNELYSVLPEELVEALRKHAPIKLMSSIKVAEAFGKTRQWVDWAIKKYEDQFPKPIEVNRYKGWLATDILHFRDKVLPELLKAAEEAEKSK
ncbi:hypothetical protein ACWA2C_28265 [Priestia megaterium]